MSSKSRVDYSFIVCPYCGEKHTPEDTWIYDNDYECRCCGKKFDVSTDEVPVYISEPKEQGG